jgi:uncharacterized protein YecE (DUF72 family)
MTIESSRVSEKYKVIDLESAEDNEADKRVGETLSEELKRASSLTERTLKVVVKVVDPPLPSATAAETCYARIRGKINGYNIGSRNST